jgi:hypothetical protein
MKKVLNPITALFTFNGKYFLYDEDFFINELNKIKDEMDNGAMALFRVLYFDIVYDYDDNLLYIVDTNKDISHIVESSEDFVEILKRESRNFIMVKESEKDNMLDYIKDCSQQLIKDGFLEK